MSLLAGWLVEDLRTGSRSSIRPSAGIIAVRAPVAQWIERRPPEPSRASVVAGRVRQPAKRVELYALRFWLPHDIGARPGDVGRQSPALNQPLRLDLDGVEDRPHLGDVLLGGIGGPVGLDHQAAALDVEDPELLVLAGFGVPV